MNPVMTMELRNAVISVLDELPSERIVEVLNFAKFVKDRGCKEKRTSQLEIKSVPVEQLEGLAGIVSWGGDALEDSERLYDGKD